MQVYKQDHVSNDLITMILKYQYLLFYYYQLFLPVLGLHCCLRVLSSCGERQLLTSEASLVEEYRLYTHRLQQLQLSGCKAQCQQLWCVSLAAPPHVGSSQIKDQTGVPCIARQTLSLDHQGSPDYCYLKMNPQIHIFFSFIISNTVNPNWYN